jgi:hypothetical protein
MHRPSLMCFLNDGALYSETLDHRHVCGNALRMCAAWSFVAERGFSCVLRRADSGPRVYSARKLKRHRTATRHELLLCV